jgi:hypothetical protein
MTWCSKLAGMEQQTRVHFLEVIRNECSGSFALLAHSNRFFMSWICVGDKDIRTMGHKGQQRP